MFYVSIRLTSADTDSGSCLLLESLLMISDSPMSPANSCRPVAAVSGPMLVSARSMAGLTG